MNGVWVFIIAVIVIVIIFLIVDKKINIPDVSTGITKPVHTKHQTTWVLYEDNKPVVEKDNETTKLKNLLEITKTENLITITLPEIVYANKADYTFNKLKSETKLLPSNTPKFDLQYPIDIYIDNVLVIGTIKINKDGTIELEIPKQGKNYIIPGTTITYSLL